MKFECTVEEAREIFSIPITKQVILKADYTPVKKLMDQSVTVSSGNGTYSSKRKYTKHKAKRAHKHWKKSELKFLSANMRKSPRALAKELGRSVKSISAMKWVVKHGRK